jgi:NhaC family Na+:H+ antiporter
MLPVPRKPSLTEAITPIIIAAVIIAAGVLLLGGVPVPILLALACIAPALMALRLGYRWKDVEGGMLDGMRLALGAAVILLVVGTTIGAWVQCGTVGAMVSYGLLVLQPSFFLPAACLLCAIVSLSIGSSWTTAATVGVALMGIGAAIGVPAPMCAGAVLSGSYFGDKMSPLSDTTNLAPGIAGAGLFEHIQAMFYTTLPALGIALVLYGLLGLSLGADTTGYSPEGITSLRAALGQAQQLSPWLFLPPALVIVLALARVPAVPALLAATAAGGVMAAVFQGEGLGSILVCAYDGYATESGNPAVDELLNRGGMASMLDTVALVLAATAFGGIMERAGFVHVLLEALLQRVRSVGGLITSTIVSCIAVNGLLCEQYLAIVLPGRMFMESYPRFGLQPRMLSRTIEDGGTVTSCLFPWNSGGAFMAATLGVATVSYVPFAFLNLLVPLIAIAYAWTGTFILRQDPTEPRGISPAHRVTP